MELARALTNRRRQNSDANYLGPARAASTRAGPISRSAISNPIQLISTTNALAYNAPNIHGSPADDSDSSASLGPSSRATTPEATPDEHLEPNHLSQFFPQSRPGLRSSKESLDNDSPRIPTRALSHTKKSHQAAARQRASSRATPPPTSIPPPSATSYTFDIPSRSALQDHPFSAEIAQVNEVAEKFGTREAMIADEEEQFLSTHGLCKFAAEDYMDEIQGLFGAGYNNPFSPSSPVWI